MLARKSLLILLTNVVGAFSGIVALFAIGHYMGPEPFGMFAFTLSVVTLLGFLATLGLGQAHQKRVSQGMDMGACLATYATLKVSLVALFIIVVVAAAMVWDRWWGLFSTTLLVVFVTLAHVAFQQTRHIATDTFDALRQTARTQAVHLTDMLVRTPLVVLAALVFGVAAGTWVPLSRLAESVADTFGIAGPASSELGALLLAVAYVAGSFISMGMGFVLLRRARYPFGRFDMQAAKSYAAFAGPLALLTLVTTMSHEMDRFMVGYFWSPSEVGYYFSAQRLVTIVLVLPTAIATLFFPLISELASRNQTETVRIVARTAQRYLGMVMVLIALIMALFAEPGIRMLQGPSFLPAAPILSILAFNALIMAFTVVSRSIVKGYDHPGTVARAGMLVVAANVSLNVVFIPESILGIPMLGMRAVGAAWATLIASAIGFGYLTFQATRLSGGVSFSFSTVKQLAAGGATLVLLMWLQGLPVFGGLERFYHLASIGAVGGTAYFGLLWLMREVGRKDLLLVLDILHPGKMARSIREDFDRWDE